MKLTEFKGPIIVTVSYVFLYYIFLVNILRVKVKLHKKYRDKGEKFDRYFSQDREMLAADRIQLNMLEQMPTFLTLLWLYSFFIDIQCASILGGIYIFSRAIYPLILNGKMGREVTPKIFISTFIGYGVQFYFAIALLIKTIN